MAEEYAIGVPAEYIQMIEHPTMWDKIRQLPAEAFNEWLYAVVKNAVKTLGIDVEITDEMKAATLKQLTEPWEE